jgi:hypothetical protein
VNSLLNYFYRFGRRHIALAQAFVYVAVLLTSFSAMPAETPDEVETRVKAALIFQFTKFIEWPEFKGDFVINVIEDESLAKALEVAFSTRQVSGHAVKVQNATYASSVIKPGQIGVYPKKESSLIKPAIEKLKGKPTLVITQAQDLAAQGSNINFVLIDGKLRFELNANSTKQKNLKVDPKLVGLGIPVE